MIKYQLNGIVEKKLHMYTKHIAKLKIQDSELFGVKLEHLMEIMVELLLLLERIYLVAQWVME